MFSFYLAGGHFFQFYFLTYCKGIQNVFFSLSFFSGGFLVNTFLKQHFISILYLFGGGHFSSQSEKREKEAGSHVSFSSLTPLSLSHKKRTLTLNPNALRGPAISWNGELSNWFIMFNLYRPGQARTVYSHVITEMISPFSRETNSEV